MAMTIKLLEKFVVSEVENLHLRIDDLVKDIQEIFERLGVLEHQMSCVVESLEDIKTNMVTKKDLLDLVTKNEMTEIIESALKRYLPS